MFAVFWLKVYKNVRGTEPFFLPQQKHAFILENENDVGKLFMLPIFFKNKQA